MFSFTTEMKTSKTTGQLRIVARGENEKHRRSVYGYNYAADSFDNHIEAAKKYAAEQNWGGVLIGVRLSTYKVAWAPEVLAVRAEIGGVTNWKPNFDISE